MSNTVQRSRKINSFSLNIKIRITGKIAASFAKAKTTEYVNTFSNTIHKGIEILKEQGRDDRSRCSNWNGPVESKNVLLIHWLFNDML
jgi:hypothetical protein